MKHTFHTDAAPLSGKLTAMPFADGGTVTPERAAEVMFAAEGGAATAARQRMIERKSRPHSQDSEAARRQMIERK